MRLAGQRFFTQTSEHMQVYESVKSLANSMLPTDHWG